jgi:hypothetical protein
MTRLSDAEAELPPDGRCGCGCALSCYRLAYRPGWETQCDADCPCSPCPVCHPENFEDDDWEPPEFVDADCRPVVLASGETVPVLGGRELSPQGAAALGELVEAVRAMAPLPDVGADELWARIGAARGDRYLTEIARQAGVKRSVLFRIGQGRMPDGDDLAAIEAWLEAADG